MDIPAAMRLSALVLAGLFIRSLYKPRRRAEDTAHQQRQEFQAALSSIGEAERFARAQAKLLQERLAFLVQINTILASEANYEHQLENVAHVVVPYLADWCVIYILDKNGSIRPVAAAGRDIAKQALLAEMHSRYMPTLHSSLPVAEVLRMGVCTEDTGDNIPLALAWSC